MLVMQLARGTSTLSFSIRDTGTGGWELAEDRDQRRVRTVKYTDWHRVERAAALINLEVAGLERDGWIITRRSSRFHEPVA